MSNASRFVLVSRDAAFSQSLRDDLKKTPAVDMVIQVTSQAEAENVISRGKSTIVLCDVDTVTADPQLMLRMATRFTNVLIVLTANKEFAARRFIAYGIRDFVPKPAILNSVNIKRFIDSLVGRMSSVAAAAQTTINYKDVSKTAGKNDMIVAIASSTGGPEALAKVFDVLPSNGPPVLVVQHLPSGFTKFFANRLNGEYPIDIKEAQTGDYLLQGQVLIAPAGNHMRLTEKQGKLVVDCFLGPRMHGVIPAADILFESVANIQKRNAVGVILTGMGADGARGLMLMHNAGAKTIGQNKETCVVYGMPKVAKDLKAVDFELPINEIGSKILSLYR